VFEGGQGWWRECYRWRWAGGGTGEGLVLRRTARGREMAVVKSVRYWQRASVVEFVPDVCATMSQWRCEARRRAARGNSRCIMQLDTNGVSIMFRPPAANISSQNFRLGGFSPEARAYISP
jgi:hypothetical protein